LRTPQFEFRIINDDGGRYKPETANRNAQAFDKAMQNPELIAEAKRGGLSIAATSGEALTKLVNDLLATRKDLVDKMEELIK
jgi:tripartite-type tricarboxylate transporter receptor subunit TctC